jgi:hypothetical protein
LKAGPQKKLAKAKEIDLVVEYATTGQPLAQVKISSTQTVNDLAKDLGKSLGTGKVVQALLKDGRVLQKTLTVKASGLADGHVIQAIVGLKENLKDRLQRHFKPLGIIAWSRSCGLGSTGSYEDDPGFKLRERGVCFMKLFLSGINYFPNPSGCYVEYSDHAYLLEHWKEEKALLDIWCQIIGLSSNQYVIAQPANESEAIFIEFEPPLDLFAVDMDSDSEFSFGPTTWGRTSYRPGLAYGPTFF